MKFGYRVQEWAADKFSSVQYPHLRTIKTDRPAPMAFGSLLSLAVVGGAALLLGGLALVFMLYFVVPSFFS